MLPKCLGAAVLPVAPTQARRMTTIIKAATAADFLSLLPALTGYTPARSLALVPFSASRTLGVMRVDLPEPGSPEMDSTAATLIGMVCKLADADAVTPVVYTDLPFAAPDGSIVFESLVQALLAKADACGLRVTDALCVASDGWGSYLDSQCPPGGRPLGELGDSEILQELPAELRSLSRDQLAGAELPVADLAEKERVARALGALDHAVRIVCGDDSAPPADDSDPVDIAGLDPMALAAACALDDVPALFEDALEWDAANLRPFDAAALIWCLSRPALRDVALSQWCAGIDAGDAAMAAQLDWEGGQEYPAHLAAHMWGEGARPDPERLERALSLARHLAAAAPRASRPGVLAGAAWLAWALGRSTHASWYVDRAIEIEPDHGLSGIIATFVSAGHLPEWAYDRRAR